MEWTSVLGSAVIAALLTSILNNLFLWRRDETGRRREARGMLQRARSAAAMFLEATAEAASDPDVRVDRQLQRLREMMLSREFTLATSDLDLDDGYRALEGLQIQTQKLSVNSIALASTENDTRAYVMHSDGEPNADFDQDVYETLDHLQRQQAILGTIVKTRAAEVVDAIEKQQSLLSDRSRRFFGTLRAPK